MEIKELSALPPRELRPEDFTGLAQCGNLLRGSVFHAIVRVKDTVCRADKNGNPYITAELMDAEGSCGTTVFPNNKLYEFISNVKPGEILSITGTVSYYNNAFRPEITRAEHVTAEYAEQMGKSLFPTSPRNPAEMEAELHKLVESEISDPNIRELLDATLFSSKIYPLFRVAVAAVKMHHAYKYGLLEHTLGVAKNTLALARNYKEANDEVALAGALLHDIGKVYEYKEPVAILDKTRVGNLQSHMALGYAIVHEAAASINLPAKLREEIEHIILSHHGKLEFGAVVMPATPEAFIVHSADMTDALLGAIAAQSQKNFGANKEFSEYIPMCGAQILLDRYTPDK